jgi:hypothetical protein
MTTPTSLEAFSKKFLRGLFATYPVRASNMGLHGYDGLVMLRNDDGQII